MACLYPQSTLFPSVMYRIKNRNLINTNQKAILLEWSHKVIKRLIVYVWSLCVKNTFHFIVSCLLWKCHTLTFLHFVSNWRSKCFVWRVIQQSNITPSSATHCSSFTFTRVSSWSRRCVVWSTQSSGSRVQIPLLLRSFHKSFHICNQPAPPLSKWITLISYWGQIWAKLVKMNNTGSKKMHQMTWQVTLTRQEWEKLVKWQRNRKSKIIK